MTFEQVMPIIEQVAPVVLTVVLAKVVNQNTPHWSQWTGRAGRIVGLLTTLLDLFQKPKQYVKNVKKIKRKR